MSDFLKLLQQRVLFFDGAMGTALHSLHLPASDYQGKENCSEILVLTRPDAILSIHERYLQAGADVIETNTFGANRVVLAEFDLTDSVYEINLRAAEIARQACRHYSSEDQPRFVAGSMGPGTKLPSLGHIDFASLQDSYHQQALGLLAGGVDLFLIETCQDILQTKSAIAGVEQAFGSVGRRLPLMVQVTMESNGTMLLGTDIAAAMHILECFPLDVIGLNCATGPQEMSEHISFLGHHCRKYLSVMPNAGLPVLADGQTCYPLSPPEFARWLLRFVEEDGLNIVGGCCGTTAEHIEAMVQMIGRRAPRKRSPLFEPSLTSLYGKVPIRQDASSLFIGERTNANGSKRFRELLCQEHWDGILSMAREQESQGSHLLDVCTALVGRDEKRDMTEVIRRFALHLNAPLVIDSTEPPVIAAALQLCGGKCLVNSIHMEDGEEKMAAVLPLCRKFGAAVVALTIDETGMAKTCDQKLQVAERIFELATRKFGMAPDDLFFDPLTFTICTGNEDDRSLAHETLKAIEHLTQTFPKCHTLLGVSNVSFGLRPGPRKILNSVFLHHARERGLTAAIVHASAILPYFRIPEEARTIAEDLIFDRRRPGYDPLTALMQLFSEEPAVSEESKKPTTVEDRLKMHIVEGTRQGLEDSLQEALLKYDPLTIINQLLLVGMKTVGELFGSGQMQLPFVLQSAETMKAAVTFLEPKMDKSAGPAKGRMVIATVRGDVHDIGKNLVDIILSNNGYSIVNLGIKQTLHSILEAAQKESADVIGMSGLLVKSVAVMRENLEEMTRQNIRLPVILGGAALTRKYVENECRAAYHGQVFYAKDAFEGLHLMDQICSGKTVPSAPTKKAVEVETPPQPLIPSVIAKHKQVPRPLPTELVEAEPMVLQPAPVPTAPFWGTKVIDSIPLRAVLPFLNETILFSFHWGYKKAGLSAEEYALQLKEIIQPRYRNLIETCEREGLLSPRGIYGFFPCQRDGNNLILYHPDGSPWITFHFPRQSRAPYRCLSDYFHTVDSGIMDVVPLQAVTVGQEASLAEKRWFAENRYNDYVQLHGFSVEAAEATAEYVHRQIRVELGIASEDDRSLKNVIKLGFRGCRYSLGYPACPNLDDQPKLLQVLESERIGLTLGDNYQMWPEQSTSAIVVHHPQACYFAI